MATGKIFIPETCRVGFQERDDTFAKKLAYVIYYDAKGKLRKEVSWESWRHKPGGTKGYGKGSPLTVDVAPYDFENVPTSGFVLNKGHTRYAWSSFGSKTTVIRIYDPRGIEFEVTPENLVALLMHTDCSHREIQGELVYAWCGTELMLLPCASEEYQSAMNYTNLQGTRVSANDLKEGFTYVTKHEEHLVYLGRHMWYETTNQYDDKRKARIGKKQHIFYDPNWDTGKESWEKKPKFRPVKSVSSVIAKQISDGCHDEYANLVDALLKIPNVSRVVGWEKRPLHDKDWDKKWDAADTPYKRVTLSAVIEEADRFVAVTIGRYIKSTSQWDFSFGRKQKPAVENETRLAFHRQTSINKDGSACHIHGIYRGGYDGEIFEDRKKFFRLFAVFENGLKKEWMEINDE